MGIRRQRHHGPCAATRAWTVVRPGRLRPVAGPVDLRGQRREPVVAAAPALGWGAGCAPALAAARLPRDAGGARRGCGVHHRRDAGENVRVRKGRTDGRRRHGHDGSV